MALAAEFDFSGYKLDHVELHQCNYNWKTFIEVYLEDYHVVPFHPGLGNFVTCDDLAWQFGDWYSVQTVGITRTRQGRLQDLGRWQKAVLDSYGGARPKHGAIWLTYYPNIMVEWYPHVLVVSTVIPQDRTDHQRRRVLLSRGHRPVRARIRRRRAGRLHGNRRRGRRDRASAWTRGRRALWREGRSEAGPYQSPIEDGMQHFHEFLRRELGKPG